MRRRLLFVSAFLVSSALGAQAAFAAPAATPAGAKAPISVKATVDRRSALVGDRIRLRIEVAAPKHVEVRFPKFADYRIGDLEIKDSGLRTKEAMFGKRVYSQSYVLSGYTVGKLTIPEIDVGWREPGAKDWQVRKTRAMDISIMSVLPQGGADDIRPVKGPLAYRNPYWGILALAAALCGALALAAFVYAKLKSYAPVRLPHETALEELEAIRSAYLQGGDIKDFYVGVSDCVRRYIERAFQLRAPEMTTEEFLYSLRDSSGLTMAQKEPLEGFMAACDLVKFAKYAPTREEAEAVFTTAQRFIMEASGAFVEEAREAVPPQAGEAS
jgi:hypothetical protein